MDAHSSHSMMTSADPNINELLSLIQGKVKTLRTAGLTKRDRDVLKARLSFIWNENVAISGRGTTLWRKHRSRRTYHNIQDRSQHLFLVAVLVITPTVCAQTIFERVVDIMTSLQSYEQFRISLDPSAQPFFEDIAIEQGFSGNERYLSFRRELFPQSQDPRHIQFAYSSIPLDNIPFVFQVMQNGIMRSQLWSQERQRCDARSNFVTALVPAGDLDCCFTITVGREEMMEGLRQLGLTRISIS